MEQQTPHLAKLSNVFENLNNLEAEGFRGLVIRITILQQQNLFLRVLIY